MGIQTILTKPKNDRNLYFLLSSFFGTVLRAQPPQGPTGIWTTPTKQGVFEWSSLSFLEIFIGKYWYMKANTETVPLGLSVPVLLGVSYLG